MKREIKFNAWLPFCRVMLEEVTVYPDMIGIGLPQFDDNFKNHEDGFEFDGEDVITTDGEQEKVMSVISGEDWIYIEPEYYALMQYTGLKDKKGKEIYEGDHFGEPAYPVVWEKGAFFYEGELLGDQADYLEVKGNIYKTLNY